MRIVITLILMVLILATDVAKSHYLQNKKLSNLAQTKPELKQQPSDTNKNDQSEDSIIIKSNLVVLDVAVFDQENRFVGNLKKENFKVFEDQIEQTIESCTSEEAPISLGFVIDTSGSMRQKLPTVVDAALFLARSAKKGDEFFVVDFKEKSELIQEFTPKLSDIEDALDNLLAGSGTALLDAISVSAAYAHKEGKNRRKAIVVMSDGDERDSFYTVKQLVNLMHEYEVQVYLVGFTDELSEESGIFKKSQRKKAQELIAQIAAESGGKAFFPEALNQLSSIAKQINSDLRAQYSISYIPTNDKTDGTYRKISVHAFENKRKLITRTRTGYTAAKEEDKKTTNVNN